MKWKNERLLKIGQAIGLLLLLSGLVACGYPSPSNGGGLTPYVAVVTPTPLPATAMAYADATVLARYTPTPLPLTFVAPLATSTAAAAQTNRPAPVPPTPSPTLAVQGDQYTVQQGDTLLGIAIRFNVEFEELTSLNNITDRNSIKVGQKLTLPKRKIGTPGAGLTVTPLG